MEGRVTKWANENSTKTSKSLQWPTSLHRIDSRDHYFKFEKSGMQKNTYSVAVSSHKMLLRLIPLDCILAKKSKILEKKYVENLFFFFWNEKDDEMDLEVNTVCHRNEPAPPLGTSTDRVFWSCPADRQLLVALVNQNVHKCHFYLDLTCHEWS